MSDLGALTSLVSSSSAWVSNSGLIAGLSENGEIDPLIPGFPELRAVLWKNGKIIDLGTMEGGNESAANAVNNRGQVVGLALTTISEVTDGVDFSMAGLGYQTRAFVWEKGVMQDLRTLPGGTDAIAFAVNDRGQVMGQSYTADSAPATTPYCAFFPLTQHGFLWEKGKMVDVGTLGGSCTFTYGFNNRGRS
jgi:probable HAF family extracellular repeat protein